MICRKHSRRFLWCRCYGSAGRVVNSLGGPDLQLRSFMMRHGLLSPRMTEVEKDAIVNRIKEKAPRTVLDHFGFGKRIQRSEKDSPDHQLFSFMEKHGLFDKMSFNDRKKALEAVKQNAPPNILCQFGYSHSLENGPTQKLEKFMESQGLLDNLSANERSGRIEKVKRRLPSKVLLHFGFSATEQMVPVTVAQSKPEERMLCYVRETFPKTLTKASKSDRSLLFDVEKALPAEALLIAGYEGKKKI